MLAAQILLQNYLDAGCPETEAPAAPLADPPADEDAREHDHPDRRLRLPRAARRPRSSRDAASASSARCARRRGPTACGAWGSSRSSPTCSIPDSLDALPEADRVLYCVGFDRSAGVADADGLRRRPPQCPGSAGRPRRPAGLRQLDGRLRPGRRRLGRRGLADRPRRTSRAGSSSTPRTCCAESPRSRPAGRHPPLRGPLRPGPDPPPGAAWNAASRSSGDPDRPLNLIHIDDAAAAAVAALDRGRARPDLPRRRRPPGPPSRILHAGRPAPRRPAPLRAPRARAAPRRAARSRTSGSEPRMRDELGVTLAYPDITTGLPAAISGECDADRRDPRSVDSIFLAGGLNLAR